MRIAAESNNKTIKSWMRIPLSRGKYTIVDAKNFEWLMQWKWHYAAAGYAARKEHLGPDPIKKRKYLYKVILMHRIVNNTPDGVKTDHRDGDGLNNLESNLRDSTHSQNIANHKKNSNNTSGYKGVIWDKRAKKWVAQIKVNYKRKWLGTFDTAHKASLAYDLAAKKYFGEFANLNSSNESL